MSTHTSTAVKSVNEELLTASEALLAAVKALSKDPSVDFTLPAYAPVAQAHANLHDVVVDAKTVRALAKALR